MSTFWILFWVTFYATPLFFLLSMLTASGGYKKSSAHIWVYVKSGAKSHDARVREVWEHKHPEKSWETHQLVKQIGCLILLMAILFFGLVSMASELLLLPASGFARYFQQIGSIVLGIMAGAFYWFVTSALFEKLDSKSLSVLKWIFVAASVLMVAFFLFPAFSRTDFELSFSHHWIWLPLGLIWLLPAIHKIVQYKTQQHSLKRGGKVSDCAYTIIIAISKTNTSFLKGLPKSECTLENVLNLAVQNVDTGVFDSLYQDQKFFKSCEAVMLDLVSGRQLTIADQKIYEARGALIRAVQVFYRYGIEKMRCTLHPQIAATLKK
jgi:hypothetical protein